MGQEQEGLGEKVKLAPSAALVPSANYSLSF